MLLSAAKLAVLVLAQSAQTTPSPLSGVADSLMFLGPRAAPTGVAVLIDSSGLFLTSAQPSDAKNIPAINRDGDPFQLRVMATDPITQLTLVKASPWTEGKVRPVALADEKALRSQRLFAVMPSAVVLGDLVSTNRPGLLEPSGRYMPLSEIRFELTNASFPGAVVFTLDGKFAGIINAALSPATDASLTSLKGLSGEPSFGPKGLVVGYSVAPNVLKRVVDGFNQPSHTPLHPSFGIYSRTTGIGVVIERVDMNSPAQKAGLMAGDVVLSLDNTSVKDAFALASLLFDSEIGIARTFKVKRNNVEMTFQIQPAVQPLTLPIGETSIF